MKTYEYLDIFRKERVEPQAEKKLAIIAMFVYLSIFNLFC
jgi:hypothetical protein